MSLNYYDIEEGLLAIYRDENPDDKGDQGFDDWMAKPSTKSIIQDELDNLVQGGYGEPLDESMEDLESPESEEEFQNRIRHARRLGFFGDKEDLDKWMSRDYGKHKQQVYDKIESIVGSARADEVFDLWDRTKGGFNMRWEGKNDTEHLEDLKEILGPKGQDLIEEIEDKWAASSKSLSDYYATSDQRGGFTGD